MVRAAGGGADDWRRKGVGPACLLRHLLASRVAPPVLDAVRRALLETPEEVQAADASDGGGDDDDEPLLLAVHIRRGDSAMGRECAGCVPSWEPDVHKPDRVTSQELARGIGCVAATVGTLQQQLRRRVLIARSFSRLPATIASKFTALIGCSLDYPYSMARYGAQVKGLRSLVTLVHIGLGQYACTALVPPLFVYIRTSEVSRPTYKNCWA